MSAATAARAPSTAAAARRPYAWPLLGLPKHSNTNGAIAAATCAGSVRGALWRAAPPSCCRAQCCDQGAPPPLAAGTRSACAPLGRWASSRYSRGTRTPPCGGGASPARRRRVRPCQRWRTRCRRRRRRTRWRRLLAAPSPLRDPASLRLAMEAGPRSVNRPAAIWRWERLLGARRGATAPPVVVKACYTFTRAQASAGWGCAARSPAPGAALPSCRRRVRSPLRALCQWHPRPLPPAKRQPSLWSRLQGRQRGVCSERGTNWQPGHKATGHGNEQVEGGRSATAHLKTTSFSPPRMRGALLLPSLSARHAARPGGRAPALGAVSARPCTRAGACTPPAPRACSSRPTRCPCRARRPAGGWPSRAAAARRPRPRAARGTGRSRARAAC